MPNSLEQIKPRKILLLNWRDPWHPKAGGAEILTLRIMERLAKAGWQVEWFSASYPGALGQEYRDGILYVHAGSQLTVHKNAFMRYRKDVRFDIVVDQINTIPFYAMTYSVPSIAWFQQIAREVWLYEAPFPLNRLGYVVEPLYLRPYRFASVITISPSTVTSLREIGLRGPMYVLPMASDEPCDAEIHSRDIHDDIAVVGRVAPSKRIEESLEAAALLVAEGWQGKLHVIGSAQFEYEKKLRKIVQRLALGNRVIFHGKVENEKRRELLSKASAIWMTSVREGWGMVVTEAGAKGTPAVVYDVPGLRDAVQNGKSGFVVEQSPEALKTATLQLFENWRPYATEAHAAACRLSWEHTAFMFASYLDQFLKVELTK